MTENPGPVEPGSGPVDWVELGDISGAESVEPSRRRRFKLLPLLLVAGVAVAVVVAVVGGGGSNPPTATQPTPSASGSGSTPAEGGPTTPVVVPAEPVVRQASPHLLGVSAGWELFGRGPDAVVRVELAAGRVTTTGVPAVQSTGPISFVVGADRVIIRPLDNVSGYAVPDRSATAALTGTLAQSNVVLPGPDLQHIWRQIGSGNSTTMGLATLDGTIVGRRFAVPATAMSPLEPDGAGYFYFIGVGGAYDVRPGFLNRVTTGSLLAVGPHRWVAVECDDAYRCSTVTLDVSTGVRRVIGAPRSPNVPIGSVAPDGSVAAIYQVGPSGVLTLQLLDLASGQARTVRTEISQDFNDQTTVWAPDSSRLFAIDARNRVQVVDPATGLAHPLALDLPPLSQLAVRAAG